MSKPAPPKRPLTGYFRFRGDVYKDTVASNPSLAPKQIMSLIGANWSKLTDSAKAVYNNAWKVDQTAYKAAKAKYEAKYGKIVSKSKQEANVDPNRPAPPKRPINGFFRFVAEVLAEFKTKFASLKHSQVISKIGAKWATMDSAAQYKYNHAYESEKGAYVKARATFEKKWGKIKNRRKNKRGKDKKGKTSKKKEVKRQG